MHSYAQIIATIGPVSGQSETLKSLIESGMDIARLNFSWGTHKEHEEYIKNIRWAADEAGKKVLIIQDLSGPRAEKEKGHLFDESQDILTEKDLKDLEFGIGQEVDYVAMSFVGSGEDIARLRGEMKKRGKIIPIIAKIEREKAIDNLDNIIEEADAIMVARGDLGAQMPMEKVPFLQHLIINKTRIAGKPVIVATDMMLSMVENPDPTRAEVSDVAHAILDGADAVMLSEETAKGKYPVEAVKMMEKIVTEAENHIEDLKINPL